MMGECGGPVCRRSSPKLRKKEDAFRNTAENSNAGGGVKPHYCQVLKA